MLKPKIIRKIQKNNLIGRGCNSFPTAKKWQIVRNTPGKTKYVICNISESEPGVFKDEYILKNWPEKVIDGIQLASQTIKASQSFIYLNPEYYTQFSKKLNTLISEKKLAIEIYAKPWHDYIGGEETAVINSMHGRRVEPSIKPPYPTNQGFENCPTLVNNCETFYAVSQIKHNEYSYTRFYCYSEFSNGEYLNQKILELPIDISVKSALLKFNHTPRNEYFYQIGGGAAGTCYNSKQLNRKFNSLTSIVVYPQKLLEKDIILHWANYFVKESCGQCVPCREGTYRLRELLEKYYATGKLNQQIFDDIVFGLQNTSLCPLGQISANAILSYWKNVLKK